MPGKTQLMGVFTKYSNIAHQVNNLFELLGDDCKTIFCYEVIDNNSKQNSKLLTFFASDYDKLKDFELKPITLHRKENNVIFTVNGMNRFIGSENVEENKKVKLNLEGLENVLITKATDHDGYNMSKLILHQKYDNKKSEVVHDANQSVKE
jgi:hypothetical protein